MLVNTEIIYIDINIEFEKGFIEECEKPIKKGNKKNDKINLLQVIAKNFLGKTLKISFNSSFCNSLIGLILNPKSTAIKIRPEIDNVMKQRDIESKLKTAYINIRNANGIMPLAIWNI